MEKVSVIIPARNEKYLEQTLRNVLDNARGDIEIIVELDGWLPDPIIKMNDGRVIFHYNVKSIGQRQSINHAVSVSTGKYIIKLDAHCAVDEGFDVKLKEDCEYDWTVVPRMYNLNIETFKPKLHKVTDYMYIGIRENGEIRSEYYKGSLYRKMHKKPDLIDDTMGLMGPCFFMHKERFLELGGCDENHGGWGQQGIEVSLKAWLSGGRMVVNKKTWFSHWFRGGGAGGFPYPITGGDVKKARDYSKDLWLNNKWPLQKRNFEWVLEKFNPPSWNIGVPEGLWYQEATIKGVTMPTIRGNDTNEKRWEKYIKPLLSVKNNSGTFIDLGCNAGFYCRKMIDQGFTATGIEKDIKYFRHAEYWEKEEPKGVNLIHKNIVDYDIPKTDIVLLANVHYWLTDIELKNLVDKLLKAARKVIVIGRHNHSDIHKSKPDINTLKKVFDGWEILKTIKGRKHFSVMFENKKMVKNTMELNVKDFFLKQQCSRSRKYYPSFKKMIKTGDSKDYMEYLKWRRFKNPEAILKKHQVLIMSVKENGVLTPIKIDGFTILDGDHRLMISEVLGIETIKAEHGEKVPVSEEHKKINAVMYNHIHKKKNYPEWRGIPILKAPEDLLLYSQIIWETKPEVIIEVGTKWGGSAVYHQDNLDLLENGGRIATIDINPQVKNHDSRIKYIIGDSTSSEVINQVEHFIKNKRCMVILDGDHSKEKVLLELEFYPAMVSSGCYLVMEDCYISGVELYGPGEARDIFLQNNDSFIQTNLDRKFIAGMLIGGWLSKQ